jgi:ABC-2 type transport system permease protein
VILPQLLLCGLIVPREEMHDVLDAAAAALPMTYAIEALQKATSGDTGGRLALDAVIVLGSVAIALALGATTLRRRTP